MSVSLHQFGLATMWRPRILPLSNDAESIVAALRPRRSCLAVPGSNPKMHEKAQGLPADQVFLDLEDSVAPLAKPGARGLIVGALNQGSWGNKCRTVRVNDWTTEWTYRDVI